VLKSIVTLPEQGADAGGDGGGGGGGEGGGGEGDGGGGEGDGGACGDGQSPWDVVTASQE